MQFDQFKRRQFITLLGSAKFVCLQMQKPAMFAQMPLFAIDTSPALSAGRGQGANLLETRGRDVLSDRAIEVS